jgi:hypothetical protein
MATQLRHEAHAAGANPLCGAGTTTVLAKTPLLNPRGLTRLERRFLRHRPRRARPPAATTPSSSSASAQAQRSTRHALDALRSPRAAGLHRLVPDCCLRRLSAKDTAEGRLVDNHRVPAEGAAPRGCPSKGEPPLTVPDANRNRLPLCAGMVCNNSSPAVFSAECRPLALRRAVSSTLVASPRRARAPREVARRKAPAAHRPGPLSRHPPLV